MSWSLKNIILHVGKWGEKEKKRPAPPTRYLKITDILHPFHPMAKSIAKAIFVLCLLAVVDAFVTVATSKVVQTISPNYFCGSRRLAFASSADATGESDISTSMASEVESKTSYQSMPYQLVTLVGKSASSLVSISFFLLLATRRDALVLTLFVGSIFNAVSSKVLKKVLNHERPANLQLNENVKLKPSDGGMVS